MSFAQVFIEPHERFEAIEAYRDRLTEDQIGDIQEAPDTALICIEYGVFGAAKVTVIEEG